MIDRQSALALLAEQKTPPSLLQHALASEAIMRALAQHFGENEDLWGLTGLLHDLDYPATAENASRRSGSPAMASMALRIRLASTCSSCT